MQVLHVCAGQARTTLIQGRPVLSAMAKQPVAGPVGVQPLGLDGDEQADLAVHGGLAKAVYAYPSEHLRFWQTVRAQAGIAPWDQALAPGTMGENLLLQGVRESELWIGDRLHVGSAEPGTGCVLVVSEPRQPCYKFAAAMGFAQAVKLMLQSGFSGAYLAVLEPGQVQAGDAIRLEPGPREVNLRELFLARARP